MMTLEATKVWTPLAISTRNKFVEPTRPPKGRTPKKSARHAMPEQLRLHLLEMNTLLSHALEARRRCVRGSDLWESYSDLSEVLVEHMGMVNEHATTAE